MTLNNTKGYHILIIKKENIWLINKISIIKRKIVFKFKTFTEFLNRNKQKLNELYSHNH